jgi:hypothetical protein
MPIQNLWRTIGINAFLYGTPFMFLCILAGVLFLNKKSKEWQKEQSQKNTTQKVFWLVTILLFLVTLGSSVLVALGYSTLSVIATRLAPDQQVSSFTFDFYTNVKRYLTLVCFISGTSVAAILIFRQWMCKRIINVITLLTKASVVFGQDTRQFIKHVTTNTFFWWELFLLSIITLLAAWFRWIYLDGPMHHDEAYTFIAFASRPLSGVISDYHLPNNHVLHSILVHFSTRIFGIEPWAVRFPAYLSGVFCVPGVYILSKFLYDRKVAFLSASISASLPLLVELRDARGYTLLALLTLLSFSLGLFVLRNKNVLAWIILLLISALGFYDVPVMLYPAGALYLWLFLSMVVGDVGGGYRNRWQFFKWLSATGIFTLGLTLIFYMPLIIGSGLKSLIGNPYIASQAFDPFFETLVTRLPEIWQNWSRGTPAPGCLAGIGLAGAIIFNKRLTNHKISMFLATSFWIGIALLVQRPQIWGRIWSFIVPLMLVWMTAGLLAWINLIKIKGMNLSFWVNGLAIALVLGSGIISACKNVNESKEIGYVEEVVQFLAPNLKEGDLVISSTTNEPQLWYYFRLYQLSDNYLKHDPVKKYKRLFVIIYNGENETPYNIITRRGLKFQGIGQHSSLYYQVVGQAKIYTIMGDKQ